MVCFIYLVHQTHFVFIGSIVKILLHFKLHNLLVPKIRHWHQSLLLLLIIQSLHLQCNQPNMVSNYIILMFGMATAIMEPCTCSLRFMVEKPSWHWWSNYVLRLMVIKIKMLHSLDRWLLLFLLSIANLASFSFLHSMFLLNLCSILAMAHLAQAWAYSYFTMCVCINISFLLCTSP